jgi:hypothetical protein
MALVSTSILARGQVLALGLRREGRGDEAAVVEALDSVDAERLPATAEEIDVVSRNAREQWTWVGKDA